MKKKVSGLLVTTKMTKLWAEHKNIKQKGKSGGRARLRKAELNLTKTMAEGKHEEAKEVLGDKLYAEMTRDASIDGSKLSAAVSPDAKMKATNNIHKQNQITKEKQSDGSMTAISTTDAKQFIQKSGDAITILPKQVGFPKFRESNRVTGNDP